MRHYVHVGTGNYNAKTARLYEDFGLFTTDPEIAADVADAVQLADRRRALALGYRKALVAPEHMRDRPARARSSRPSRRTSAGEDALDRA